MTVIDEAIRLAEGLLAVVEEETQRLTAGESIGALKSLVESKVRLTEQLERQWAILRKSDPAAIKAQGEEKNAKLADLIERLATAAADNGKIVLRKQTLTDDLLGAVLEEARRTNGATIMRYSDKGGTKPGHRSAAVAVDARL